MPVPLLWDAVRATDELSGSPRGWVTLAAAAEPEAAVEPHSKGYGCSGGCHGGGAETAGFPSVSV